MRQRLLMASLAIGLIVSACAGGGTTSTATPRPAATATPAAPAATAAAAATAAPAATGTPAAPAGSATVKLATSSLGEILVDSAGKTLYAFTPDEATTEPTCYDACADNWPALLVTGAFTVGEGLDMTDFTTATRTDGGTQLKIGTRPLYHYAGDSAAGDTNGQALGEKWYVIGADGELIKQ